jgi:hypothetical protein
VLLKAVRFVAILLAALTLGMGFCHLLQFPSRMGWDQYLWVGSTVQGGLYSLFGSIGAVIDVATVIALALTLWWVLVYPVNVELAKWVNGPVPSDWTAYRARWEWGHPIISLLQLAGFAALIASLLADTGRPLR